MLANAISGVVLLALSMGYYIAADAMPTSFLDTTVPSSAFPKLLAMAGATLSAALIVQSAIKWRLATPSAPSEEKPQGGLWLQHRRAIGLLGIVVLFVVALEIVGYPVSIGLLILAVSAYQGYPISKLSIAVAIGGGLFFWLFFMVLLGIHMPLGIWPRLLSSLAPSFA